MIAMSTMEIVLGIGGLILGAGAFLIYSLIVSGGAKAKSNLILEQAKRDADSKIKDAEVAVKEMELKREAESERKLSKAREKIHQRERALDKRDAGIQQQSDDLKKQEQFIESSQNRLKVKLEQIGQTEKDLNDILTSSEKSCIK
jgi:ribonuclease Y